MTPIDRWAKIFLRMRSVALAQEAEATQASPSELSEASEVMASQAADAPVQSTHGGVKAARSKVKAVAKVKNTHTKTKAKSGAKAKPVAKRPSRPTRVAAPKSPPLPPLNVNGDANALGRIGSMAYFDSGHAPRGPVLDVHELIEQAIDHVRDLVDRGNLNRFLAEPTLNELRTAARLTVRRYWRVTGDEARFYGNEYRL